MDASDLCLIIDNTQTYLRHWLQLTQRYQGKLTPDAAQRQFVHMVSKRGLHFTTAANVAPAFSQEVIALVAYRIDWQEVAAHYNTKVSEGASTPQVCASCEHQESTVGPLSRVEAEGRLLCDECKEDQR